MRHLSADVVKAIQCQNLGKSVQPSSISHKRTNGANLTKLTGEFLRQLSFTKAPENVSVLMGQIFAQDRSIVSFRSAT